MASEVSYDLRNLCCTNSDSISLNGDREEILRAAAIKTGQSLIESIFSLPVEDSEYGPLVTLPEREEIKIPRKQHVPEPKPETKWEKFAEKKGIQKKKRSKMVWDEATQQWAPRYGYGRANNFKDQAENWVIEAKKGDDGQVPLTGMQFDPRHHGKFNFGNLASFIEQILLMRAEQLGSRHRRQRGAVRTRPGDAASCRTAGRIGAASS